MKRLEGLLKEAQRKISILKLQNKGDETEEYVKLKVLKDCNLKNYAIADTTFLENDAVSNKHRHFFKFPDLKVKTGDVIVLRTCADDDKKNAAKNEHTFYWGFDAPIWNDKGDEAVLFHINDWSTKRSV